MSTPSLPLVSPCCRHSLETHAEDLVCSACGHVFVQRDHRFLDLRLDSALAAERTRWPRRQALMHAEYRELVTDPEHVGAAFGNDFGPLRPALAELAGRVLDLGCGQGLIRHFLPAEVDYLGLEPEPEVWLDQDWQRHAERFPCLAEPFAMLRAVAEAIPLEDASIDAALAVFSVNHWGNPTRAFAEIARVLRPGGHLLLVLDDLPPRLADLLGGLPAHTPAQRREAWWQWLTRPFGQHLTKPDHLPVDETRLEAWRPEALEAVDRRWLGIYPVLSWRRRAST